MKLSPVKNAIVFKAVLPTAELLSGHLNELLFTEIGQLEKSRAGFVPNNVTNELVTQFEGGLSLSLRVDEKILPANVIRSKTAERVSQLEKEHGVKLKRRDIGDLRDSITIELYKQAFVKTTVLNAFYNTEHHLLIVATGSKPFASLLVSYLVRAVGSVKTETIHISDIKHGLTTKLKAYLNSDYQSFNGFAVGNFTQLSRKLDQKEVIKYAADVDSIADELRENLASGYIVDSINLRLDGVGFLLTENFHFKHIDLQDAIDVDEEKDMPWRWRHEAAVATLQLTNIINTLCVLLSYKPTEKEINPK